MRWSTAVGNSLAAMTHRTDASRFSSEKPQVGGASFTTQRRRLRLRILVCDDVCLRFLHAAKLADAYPFSLHASKDIHNEIGENSLDVASEVGCLVRQPGQYVVIVDAILKLLHER